MKHCNTSLKKSVMIYSTNYMSYLIHKGAASDAENTCSACLVSVSHNMASLLYRNMDFISCWGRLASLSISTLTSSDYGRLRHLRTQKRIFSIITWSVGKLSSNTALCLKRKDSMKLLLLMSNVALAVPTAVETFIWNWKRMERMETERCDKK